MASGGQRRPAGPALANEGQRWLVEISAGQWRPALGQRGPAEPALGQRRLIRSALADEGQRWLMKVNGGQRRPAGANGVSEVSGGQ